jgi:hypothetical protein
MDEPMEIPKFDLAEQIMAEQRKVAATRRKGPSRKTNAVKREIPESFCPDSKLQTPVSSLGSCVLGLASCGAEQIIAEIVARDIRQLCGGNDDGRRKSRIQKSG